MVDYSPNICAVIVPESIPWKKVVIRACRASSWGEIDNYIDSTEASIWVCTKFLYVLRHKYLISLAIESHCQVMGRKPVLSAVVCSVFGTFYGNHGQ